MEWTNSNSLVLSSKALKVSQISDKEKIWWEGLHEISLFSQENSTVLMILV